MTSNQIILVVALIAAVALIALLAGGRGGPRVTVIETKPTDRDGDNA